VTGIEVIRVDDAPMAGGDPTRRYGVAADGRVLMPGLTRDEAARACEWLPHLDAADCPLALSEVLLPVVLTDGAGPHLLDAHGRLVLVLGAHPVLPDARMAMGQAATAYVMGLVQPLAGGGWAWLVRAESDEDARVEVLDDLDAAADWPAAREWARRWAGAISTLAP
jgi:hypothetical protein